MGKTLPFPRIFRRREAPALHSEAGRDSSSAQTVQIKAQMLKGYYNDRLIDGQERVRLDRGWRANLIVEGCNRLLAALMKGQPDLGGILYLAVGEGRKEWDGAVPHPQPATTRLSTEILRRPIAAEDIIFLDSAGQPSATPTGRLQISIELTLADFPANGLQPVREFGLFGGNATAEANSGLMINHVIHPRIDISDGLTLRRTLRLDFSHHAAREKIPGLGAGLPVRSIDGVGEFYGQALASAGVNTLGDFLTIDPQAVPDIVPGVKLLEFRAKARMVMGLTVGLTTFAALSHLSISQLLTENPQTLAAMPGTFTITADMVTELQEELMPLQVALDDQQLQQMTLGSLVNTS
ncbi:MAG: hypothetical protein KKC76_06155 [Proteobacteria bacterium]|nr:hypothetical protein [Pseudomonadota bacterium]MBU4297603.1 hypothetical protein [Pseudomonadota bacterium]MCG2750034.1 hypothetical protein [Desulfobulbaceae bacterium]